MSSAALQSIVARLPDAEAVGRLWLARCPAHDGPGLSAWLGDDGAVMLTCTSGCHADAILARIGLDASDRAGATDDGEQRNRIVATYPYVDEMGAPLYETVRYDSPKRFEQRRVGPDGGWVRDIGDARQVLYRLPGVVRALKEGAPILIIEGEEGERDVDLLASHGIAATTRPTGKKMRWREDYSETLRGANVVILPDNDIGARARAENIVTSLAGKAASIRVLNLPELHAKGDVTEWFAAGHSADELRGLLAASAPWRPHLDNEAESYLQRLVGFVAGRKWTNESARWLGFMLRDHPASGTIKARLSYDDQRVFDVGMQAKQKWMAPPADLAPGEAKRVQWIIYACSSAPDAEVGQIEVPLLVQRRGPRRPEHTLTVAFGGKRVEIGELGGAEATNYTAIRNRAFEHGLLLPPPSKRANARWSDALADALERRVVEDMDTQEDADLACQEAVKAMLRKAAVGITADDLERGHVIRTDAEVFIKPQWAVRQLRALMDQDHLDRKTISAAARALGKTEKQPAIGNARPRVWAFPLPKDDSHADTAPQS